VQQQVDASDDRISTQSRTKLGELLQSAAYGKFGGTFVGRDGLMQSLYGALSILHPRYRFGQQLAGRIIHVHKLQPHSDNLVLGGQYRCEPRVAGQRGKGMSRLRRETLEREFEFVLAVRQEQQQTGKGTHGGLRILGRYMENLLAVNRRDLDNEINRIIVVDGGLGLVREAAAVYRRPHDPRRDTRSEEILPRHALGNDIRKTSN
jgi:hypothetical protein